MSRGDLFERILGSLQEAALDDACWPTASGLIDEACGSKGNMLASGDGGLRDDAEVFFARYCYRGQRDHDLEREYFEVYHCLDERLPRLRRLPDSRIVHVGEMYTDEEKKRSPAYNELLPRSDTGNSLHTRLDGPNGSRIVFTVADPVDDTNWSSAQVETIGRLLPHLRRFVRVHQALADARALGASATALLEHTRCGVIQLDRRGRIVAANGRARELLGERDGLADRGGRLRALTPADNASLQRLLARALPRFGGQGTGGSMAVRRPLVEARLVLHVEPVSEGRADLRASLVAAFVLVLDPASRAHADPDLVADALGLTPAESRVAVLLAQGNTLRGIAMATGCGESTIRWHLKNIFGKHGISRQAELVQLVLSLSVMPEARH